MDWVGSVIHVCGLHTGAPAKGAHPVEPRALWVLEHVKACLPTPGSHAAHSGEYRRQKIYGAGAAATDPEVLRYGPIDSGGVLWPTYNSAATARSASRRKRSRSPDRTFRPSPAWPSRVRLARR